MLLGVDIGTTNLKVAAYDQRVGKITRVVRRTTRTHRPRPGWAEFHADELWADTSQALRELLQDVPPQRIESIAIGSMGESGVLLDAHMQPLAPLIAWYDRRTEEAVGWWRSRLEPWTIYQITGLILDSKYSVNQMLWFRTHQPELFEAARHWLCIPDYIAWKLSGRMATDRSMASRTMLFDHRHQTWSTELLQHARLSADLLPSVLDSGTHIGAVTSEAADATGLAVGTSVVTGGHDHLVGALAAGVLGPGSTLDSTGTASAVLQLTDTFAARRALFEAGVETTAFTCPRTFTLFSSTNLAGGAVEWLVQLLWGTDAEATRQALEAAAAAPIGADGAMWLPHLLGSGTPQGDQHSRAALVGLRPEHTRGHILRALLEGLAFWLRENLEVTAQHAGVAGDGEVVAIGGATRSPLWTQIKADVSGRPFRVPGLEESVALGAALLAGVGAGAFNSHAEAVASIRVTGETFEPRPEAVAAYSDWFAHVYRRLYPSLREVNETIDRISRRPE